MMLRICDTEHDIGLRIFIYFVEIYFFSKSLCELVDSVLPGGVIEMTITVMSNMYI